MSSDQQITIREAKIEELPLLRAFEQGIVSAERPFDPTLKPGAIEYYDLGAMILAEDACVVVADAGGKPVGGGYAILKAAKPYQLFDQYAHLGFMFVDPGFRGRGINQQVIEALVAWARGQGISEVRLDVYAGNEPAIRAYEKAGFSPHLLTMRLGD
ncbi:GNAT family N-acetyltransferase [Pedobacter yulinensis]|uniref:GNAT family N-acetyltransferase n=1 Tax=Pedobacter yulinensis TaxID=2126353 RepID=A0A2T3HMF7_9SPHI|nr:GNAT family N-acetyltransferase [Pedobacter yulinensis]PST83619.1 GNAT family N-acetyltransferase [Pedobacter yulinensis]